MMFWLNNKGEFERLGWSEGHGVRLVQPRNLRIRSVLSDHKQEIKARPRQQKRPLSRFWPAGLCVSEDGRCVPPRFIFSIQQVTLS